MGYAHREMRLFSGKIVSSAQALKNVASGSTYTFLSKEGAGLVHWVLFRTRPAADSQEIITKVELDGVFVHPVMTYEQFNAYTYGIHSRPIQLMDYNVDGQNLLMYYFGEGLVYSDTLKLQASNGAAGDVVMDCFYYITEYVK